MYISPYSIIFGIIFIKTETHYRLQKEKMKHILKLILFLLASISFCQCNQDIFVEETYDQDTPAEEFAPEITEYTLNGEGDSITIQFLSGKWEISGFHFNADENMFREKWEYFPYDEQDTIYTWEPILWTGRGKGVYKDPFTQVTVERERYDELKVKVEGNSYAVPYQFCITTSNASDLKTIYINILPGTPYQIDRVEYNLDAFYTSQSEEKRGGDYITNHTSQPTSWQVDVFKNAYSLIEFEPDTDYPYPLTEPETKLPIPYFNPETNKLEIGNEEANYPPGTQIIPVKLPDTIYDITVPANSKMTIQVYWIWNEIITPYKIYFIQPKTGKRYEAEGMFRRLMPIDHRITTSIIE